MSRSLLRLLAILMALGPLSAVGAQQCEACPTIQVDVEPIWDKGGEASLAVSLRNTGSKPIRFWHSSGPWAGSQRIKLVALRLPSGEAIENDLMAVVDNFGGELNLDPGKSVQYVDKLRLFYPELHDALVNDPGRDHILFWTYELETVNGQRSPRVSGWLLLPHRKQDK